MVVKWSDLSSTHWSNNKATPQRHISLRQLLTTISSSDLNPTDSVIRTSALFPQTSLLYYMITNLHCPFYFCILEYSCELVVIISLFPCAIKWYALTSVVTTIVSSSLQISRVIPQHLTFKMKWSSAAMRLPSFAPFLSHLPFFVINFFVFVVDAKTLTGE